MRKQNRQMQTQDGHYLTRFFKAAFDFQTATSRKDYWMTTLFLILTYLFIGVPLVLLGGVAGIGIIVLFALITLIPGISMNYRRFRDVGINPLFMIIVYIIVHVASNQIENIFLTIASVILFVITIFPSNGLYKLIPEGLRIEEDDYLPEDVFKAKYNIIDDENNIDSDKS